MKIILSFITASILAVSMTTHAALFKTEKWHTANGMQVIFFPAPEIPMLDISLAFAAGSAYDLDHYGLSTLTSRLLNQGNAGKNADSVAELLANTGAQFSVETNRDMAIYNLRTLTENKALFDSVTVYNSIISKPDFPADAFTQEKKQLIRIIEQNLESPEELAELEFFKNLYIKHPYAHPVNGTIDSIQSISRDDVIAFYKRYYVGANATLVLVGAINNTKAHQLAELISSNLTTGHSIPPITPAVPLNQALRKNKSFHSLQTFIRIGQLGINHHHPSYFPLLVGNYILGGGTMISKLGKELREKNGLTYGVYSQLVPMLGNGPFIISLSTRLSQSSKALQLVQSTLKDYINFGPSDQELESAKKYLNGSFSLSLAGNHNIATLLLRIAFYQLPEDYLDTYLTKINKVTKKDIQKAFKELVNPHKLLVITLGQS